MDYTAGSGGYTWASFKQSGTEKFRVFGDYTAGYLSFYNETQSAHQLTLASSGKVGIGDTSPDNTLHVNSAGANVVAKFESTDGTGAIMLADNGGNVEIAAIGNDFHVMNAGSAAKMVVLNSGNVGIGDTDPQDKLHVVGDIRISAVSYTHLTLPTILLV